MLFMMSCLPETHTFAVVAPADYPDTLEIKSVQINPFTVSSRDGKNYGDQLRNMVEIGIANEGYLTVLNKNTDALVSGNVHFGRIVKKSYNESYKSDKKTTYTYYYVKKFTITGSYSLTDQRHNNKIIGNSFEHHFEDKWSSRDNRSAAEVKALTDEEIIHSALKEISQKIVYAVSPHREAITRQLETGSDKSIKLGNTYLVNGRADQAMSIWDQVITKTENVKNKAASYYNIGVVKEAQGKYKDAFELFSKANELWSERVLYIQAMTRVEEAERLRNKRKIQLRQLRN
jgi:tetratricopeptide (TPR) repeat protein